MASETPHMSEPHAGLERAAPGQVHVRRALLSVSDKTGIVDFARGLIDLGVEIVSTGGTARELQDAGMAVRSIESFTGFPEIMDGRVKTLHPRLYAGLLARRDDVEHLRAAAEQGIEPVDLVCVNLYPFEATLARGDASVEEIVENIDIGGPTMIRAAAKNHLFAAVVVDPADYGRVLGELRESGGRLSPSTREHLAASAFATTARYDAAISTWFAMRTHEGTFPPHWRDAYEKVSDLRYGENPHQQAAFYARVGSPTHLLEGVEQLHGKELSFNNLLDLNSARELVEDLSQPAAAATARPGGSAATLGAPPWIAGGGPACVIVKHNNPCGAAIGESILDAYTRAFACDPLSAYGGVIALNRRVDAACAKALAGQFIEVLLAPGYDTDALALLSEKKNVRLLELAQWPKPSREVEGKPVIGGQLVQTRDIVGETREQMQVLTQAQPNEEQWQDLLFAWRVCRHVRSNAIVIARGGATIGIGAGQMSRVDAVRIALEKAQAAQPELLAGAVLASDAFFPFADGPELALAAGVGAIIQPGGSVRDEEVVAAAEQAGAAMVATGVRHFRH
ncbi:MAG TPA: bifunctional phosphoribosylaminoimidazolecarboxamide formyltransferase/IMP cyclohydrolase [Solirubrobacteraceae bacterium]|jgi:phosphoribosylaminoimidazolecarboxamide formyltransferase/IMP cyclohydrolase